MKSAIIRIDYEEFVKGSYQETIVRIYDDDLPGWSERYFSTNDFITDYISAMKYILEQKCDATMHSSSVDTFMTLEGYGFEE